LIISGLSLLFSWIFGLMIDETIQKSIIQYPDSYRWYKLIQVIINTENIVTSFVLFLWIIGIITYILKKIKD